MKGFFLDGEKLSMTRLIAFMITLSIMANIIIRSINTSVVDWVGVAAVIGAIGLLVAGSKFAGNYKK